MNVTIKEELTVELKDAMKQKDVRRRELIRIIDTEVTMARTAEGFSGEVDDALYLRVMASYSKKMEKARKEYVSFGERGAAMADQLGWEVKYLSRWLPNKLDEMATAEIVDRTIAQLGVAGDPKASGRVVGPIMKAHKDEVDSGLVNRLVSAALAPRE